MARISSDLGKCLFCGKRVKTDQMYVTTADGYAHRNCLDAGGVVA